MSRIQDTFFKIVFYYALQLNEFHMDIHTHDHYEIMYVSSGQCRITVKEEQYCLSAKEFIWIDRNVPHCLLVEKGTPCVLLNLEFVCDSTGEVNLKELQDGEPSFGIFWKNKPSREIYSDSQKVCFAMKDLIDELDNSASSLVLKLLFSRLLIEISRCLPRKQLTQSGIVYVKKARDYIAQNFDQDLSTEQIAAAVGIHRSYLQSLFTRQYGCGMMAYRNQLRLDKACFLLKNTTKDITEIAVETGFNSRQELGYCFTKKFHQSPGAYRKLYARQLNVNTGNMKKRTGRDFIR